MSPPEWHVKFAFEMLELAETSLAAKRYAVVITSVLKAFDEVMDAYAAKDSGLHFHNDYPDAGSENRISWVKTNRPELFENWQNVLRCIDPKFHDSTKMQQMVNILGSVLSNIKSEQQSCLS